MSRPSREEFADTVMLASWLASEIRELNDDLQARGIGAWNDPATRRRSAEALGEAERLEGLSPSGLDEALINVAGMTPAEAGVLKREIRGIRSHCERLAKVMSDPDEGRGAARMKSLRESPEARTSLRGGKGQSAAAGRFAPILQMISQVASPSVRAEMTAKAELYILSGWAAKDLVASDDETAAARELRECAEAAGAGKASEAAFGKLSSRFGELFLDIRIANRRDELNEALPVATLEGMATNAKAGSGRVDAVIRDANDPSLIHAAMATADVSTLIEGNQILRHRAAVVDAIGRGAIPGAERAEFSFYVPSLFYDPGARTEIGDKVISQIEGGLSADERANLNIIPFMSVVSRFSPDYEGFRVSDMADFDLRLIGASADRWNLARGSVAGSPEGADKALVRAAATEIAKAFGTLSRVRGDIPRMAADSSTAEALLASLAEAYGGITEHGMAFPEALEPLQDALPDIVSFRDRLQRSTGIRNRLAPIIDLYRFPGGIEAAAAMRNEPDDRTSPAWRSRAGDALVAACAKGDQRLAKRLMEQGADILHTGSSGRTPMDAATEGGHGILAGYLGFKRDAKLFREEQERPKRVGRTVLTARREGAKAA